MCDAPFFTCVVAVLKIWVGKHISMFLDYPFLPGQNGRKDFLSCLLLKGLTSAPLPSAACMLLSLRPKGCISHLGTVVIQSRQAFTKRLFRSHFSCLSMLWSHAEVPSPSDRFSAKTRPWPHFPFYLSLFPVSSV